MRAYHSCLRAALFGGVSALALTIAAADVNAADLGYPVKAPVLKAPPPPVVVAPVMTMWIEGAAIWTGGSGINGVGFFAPSGFPSGIANVPFKPRVGWEAAAGVDWRFDSGWHASFDIRGGLSKANSKLFGFRGQTVFSCPSQMTSGGGDPSCAHFASGHLKATEHESHLVADFMIGRDLGLGGGGGGVLVKAPVAPAVVSEIQVGVRVADLSAAVKEKGVFYSSIFVTGTNDPKLGSGAGAFDLTLRSRFLGVGPRVAIDGAVPLAPQWSLDYEGGVAALFGEQKFTASFTAGGCTINSNCGFIFQSQFTNNTNKTVFNADGSLGFSYWFTAHFKGTLGIRADYYANALRTIDFNTGTYHNEDRVYWGPFVRLTGQF